MKRIVYLFMLSTLLFNCGNDESSETNTVPGGNLDPVFVDLNQKIEQTPNDASLYAARAQMFTEKEGYDEALADYKRSLELDPDNPEYLHQLANIQMDYFRSFDALKTMEQAVKAHPRRIPTLLKLAEFQLILKQHNDALYTLERVRAIEPQSAEMFFMFGEVFKDMERTDEAFRAYQSAVDNDADLIDGWLNLGRIMAEQDNDLALRYYDNALRVDPLSTTAYLAKANYLGDQEKLTEAIEVYDNMIRIAPQEVDGYYNSGLIYLDLDSTETAYQRFDMAIKVDPAFVNAYYYRGLSAEMTGNFPQAKTDYEHALRFQPDYDRAQQALDRVNKLLAG